MTNAQTAIVQLLADGSTDKEIAYRVGTSYRTVRTHLERLYDRYHVHCRAALVAQVLQDPEWLDRLEKSDGGDRPPSKGHRPGRD
ncbi:MAG TPA: LuxR C-terminal-related transcriptional regulator [Candidatus Limnocylindria bacterium]